VIYILDTNAVTKTLNQDPTFVRRLRGHHASDIGLSAIVSYELYFGAFKGQRTVRTMNYIDGLEFPILDFGKEDARTTAEIRANLSVTGSLIGPYDILIAGQALARGLILVTHNTREFSRVPGLRIEDWQTP
jgi:tRNA(fMet)-specific endonuclease VapC